MWNILNPNGHPKFLSSLEVRFDVVILLVNMGIPPKNE